MHKTRHSTGYVVSASRVRSQGQPGQDPHQAQAQQSIPPPPPCPNGFLYTVQPGDTLFFIARRFGISLDTLIAANPQIPDPNLIFPGQQICVPTAPAPPVPPPPPACPGGFLYTVQPGDTLFFIAQRFGISLDALIRANPQIRDPNRIFPGQVICIPVVTRPFCPAILFPTANAPNAMGVAFVVPATGRAFIMGHNLPPLDLGVTYVGWIRDAQTGAVVRVPLEETNIAGTWIGMREDGTPFVTFEEVFVTREPVTPPDGPTGPRMIEGSIAHCR